ncbi:MAG: hypothetical protein ACKOEI_09495, partial [Chthoniobacterales bacterium]
IGSNGLMPTKARSTRSRPLTRFRHLHGDPIIKRDTQTASDAVAAANDPGQTIINCLHVVAALECR